MCAPPHAIFNFSLRHPPSVAPRRLRTDVVISARALDMSIHLPSFTMPHFPSLMIVMSKLAYFKALEHSSSKPVIVFVPQCRLAVDDLFTLCIADDNPNRFLNIELDDLQPHLD